MPRIIDYWRGVVADIKEAESNAPEHLREVGNLWYPVLRMRVLSAVHAAGERKLGPCDLPADHAEEIAGRVWGDLLAQLHKRAAPEAWPEYASVIERVRPWLASHLQVAETELSEAIAGMNNPQVERLAESVFNALWTEKLPSREEHSIKGAINALLWKDRSWPDLGTWVPFTLYSLTSRYFEQSPYLGPKFCSSETEILDLVEMAPFGREWALNVVRRRAQARTVESYLEVLTSILDRKPLPQSSSLVARRLTLVEWLSDPEARVTRLVEAQGLAAAEAAVRRTFAAEERATMATVLRAAVRQGEYPESMDEEARRTALERIVEAVEGCALRSELIVQVAARNGKRSTEWAEAVLKARAPKAHKEPSLAILKSLGSRKATPPVLGPAQKNRVLRSLHRTLTVAARPDAGLNLEAAYAPQGTC